jgi:hypothetical protein
LGAVFEAWLALARMDIAQGAIDLVVILGWLEAL